MARRSFAICIPITLGLLFGTSAFAKKKPPAQPVNINTANSEQFETAGNWPIHGGENLANA